MTIIPIASGKGGVGKSSLAANLGILLAKAGKKTILADLDLGGSNLHVMLGLQAAKGGIGSFLTGTKQSLSEILIKTDYFGMQFLPGDAGVAGMANINFQQKKRLIKELLKLEADFLILDLGAGTALNTIDFFLISSRGIVVSAPNMAATLTAYLFLKNTVFRIIDSTFPSKSPGALFMQRLKKDGVSMQHIYISRLVEELKSADPEHYQRFSETLAAFRPNLVMNMLEEPKDASRAERLRKSAVQYLGVNLGHYGVIFKDDTQSRSLASGLPIVVYKPESVMSQAISRIAARVIEEAASSASSGALLNPEADSETFKLLEEEAAGDYADKIDSIETLFKQGALSEGDLLETLRVQQFELNQLRKENRFLKHKISQAIEQGLQF